MISFFYAKHGIHLGGESPLWGAHRNRTNLSVIELEIDFIIRKLVKREKTRTMSKQERRKMEVSMMNSEQKEVTNLQADNRLLEEMLSNENLN